MTVIKHWKLHGRSLTEHLKRHYAGLRMRMQPILEEQPKGFFDYERKDMPELMKVLDEAYDIVHMLRKYSKIFAQQAEELESTIAEHLVAPTVPDNVVQLFDD